MDFRRGKEERSVCRDVRALGMGDGEVTGRDTWRRSKTGVVKERGVVGLLRKGKGEVGVGSGVDLNGERGRMKVAEGGPSNGTA